MISFSRSFFVFVFVFSKAVSEIKFEVFFQADNTRQTIKFSFLLSFLPVTRTNTGFSVSDGKFRAPQTHTYTRTAVFKCEIMSLLLKIKENIEKFFFFQFFSLPLLD